MGILTLEDVSFAYDSKTPVLRKLNMAFECGRCYAIVGRSGAGKTTLLSLMANLIRPTRGRILYDGKDVRKINQYKYRSRYVGLVFQNYNLLPKLNSLENVRLSMNIAGMHGARCSREAEDVLRRMGLTSIQINRRILKLSGGQQQRIAIARAISTNARLILADEPTGNLDAETADEILQLLQDLNAGGTAIVMVTHNQAIYEKYPGRVFACQNEHCQEVIDEGIDVEF